MKFTNKYDLPSPVVAALTQDNYSKGKSNRSITQLIDSPQVSILKRTHDKEMSEDVSQRLWSVLGTAVHNMFENATEGANLISEKRYHYTHPDGWIISGAIDLIKVDEQNQTTTLMDYKCTSVWSVIFEKQEGHNQLNAYAWLIRKALLDWNAGLPAINELQIIAVLRDWKESELKRNGGNYPKAPILIIDIPLWTEAKQDEYMEGRIKLHDDAEFAHLTSQALPPCSTQEQWAKPPKYAVHKRKAKRATRVFDTEAEAKDFISQKPDDLHVEYRAGDKIRCTANWCGVNKWCDQYQVELDYERGSG